MEISSYYQQSVYSLRQALGIATLRKTMSQDASTVSALLKGMQTSGANLMELSVTPYKGGNIDLRV